MTTIKIDVYNQQDRHVKVTVDTGDLEVDHLTLIEYIVEDVSETVEGMEDAEVNYTSLIQEADDEMEQV